MKISKLLALIMAVGVLFTCFTACGKNNDTNTSSNGGVVSDVVSGGEDVINGVVSGAEDVVSGVEKGVEDVMPGDENKESSQHTSDNSMNNSDHNTGKLDTPAMAGTAAIDYSALSALDNTKNGWGQGNEVDDENRPTSCLSFQNTYKDYDAYFIGDDTKSIYLTFDEGYENGYTSQILDVLKEKKCPAVFFVTMPYVKENPDLIRRMIDEGHTVGNHTVNHPSMPTVSLETAANEITELHDYVQKEFNYTMTLFRPPMGEWSEQTLALTKALGYKTVFWSFAYRDWETDNQPDVAAGLEKTTSCLHNGAIYLLHAVSSTNTTILPDFIDTVRARGFTLDSMT